MDLESGYRLSVLVTLGVAMMLRLLPLESPFAEINPDWVALTILFWTLSMPARLGVLRAWLIGLCVDALTARLMGQHALAYSVMAYFSLRGRSSLSVLRMPVQMLWISGLLFLGQALILWTQPGRLSEEFRFSYWYPSVSGALIWPFLCAFWTRFEARNAS